MDKWGEGFSKQLEKLERESTSTGVMLVSSTPHSLTFSIPLNLTTLFPQKDYRNRMNLNNSIQKQWCEGQISEKEGINMSLKDEEAAYAE